MIKNITRLLCLILLLVSTGLSAQITVGSTDLPNVNTTVLVTTVANPDIDLGEETENAIWDLSDLEKDQFSVIDFAPVEGSEDAATFPNADMTRVGSLSSLLGIDVSDLIPLDLPDGTAYYENDADGNVEVQGVSLYLSIPGFGDLGQGRLLADPNYQFWHTGQFGDEFTNASEMTLEQVLDDVELPVELPAGSFLGLDVNISTDVSVNGHGTMILPDFEEEVLMYTEESTVSIYANVYAGGIIPIPLFPEPLVDTTIFTTTLRFYGKGLEFPLAAVNYRDDPEVPSSIRFMALPELPEVGFSTSSTAAGCLTVQFENETDGLATAWAWDLGNGETSTEEEPLAIYPAPGDYEVTCTATAFDGTEVVATQTITVTCEPAESDFIPSYSDDDCLQVTFFNNSAGDIAASSWDFGDGNSSSDDSPTYVYSEEGIYDVVLTVTGVDGNENSSTVTTLVSCTPLAAGFAVQNEDCPSIQFENATEGLATSYQWDFGDGTTSDQESPSHTFDMDGEYIVTLTAFSGTLETNAIQESVQIDCIGTGIVEDSANTSFSLAPNPAKNTLMIAREGALTEAVSIEIMDMTGRICSVHVLEAGQEQAKLDINNLVNGIYFANLKNMNNTVYLSQRFVVNK